MICPKCSSPDIRISRRTRWADVFQRVWGREALRCRSCHARFYASPSSASGGIQIVRSTRGSRSRLRINSRTRKRIIRRTIMVVVFGLAFALFWAFLSYMTNFVHTLTS